MLNISNLDDACVLFIENNFQQVSKTDSFKELSSEILMELLISDNLIITKEEQVIYIFSTIFNVFVFRYIKLLWNGVKLIKKNL